jgi:hypothetical protein
MATQVINNIVIIPSIQIPEIPQTQEEWDEHMKTYKASKPDESAALAWSQEWMNNEIEELCLRFSTLYL